MIVRVLVESDRDRDEDILLIESPATGNRYRQCRWSYERRQREYQAKMDREWSAWLDSKSDPTSKTV